jgi:flagellar biosynthesis/type III secretory pathway M-ring protein FliF/YscJ
MESMMEFDKPPHLRHILDDRSSPLITSKERQAMNFSEYQNWINSSLLLIGQVVLICVSAFIAFLIIMLFRRRKKIRRTNDRCSIELPLD